VYKKTGILLSLVPANDKAQVEATTPASSLTDARTTVNNIQEQICTNYQAAYQNWKAHMPPPRRVVEKKANGQPVLDQHGHQIYKLVPQPYRPAPQRPAGCTTSGTAG
jgi:hypothetical protein